MALAATSSLSIQCPNVGVVGGAFDCEHRNLLTIDAKGHGLLHRHVHLESARAVVGRVLTVPGVVAIAIP
jgi:hypothetical protein